MNHILEDLSPQLYVKDLENRKNQLEKAIKSRTASINRAPEGRVRCLRKKNHLEFYFMTEKGDKTGKYLSRSHDSVAKKIIQKDYDKKIVIFLKKEHRLITKLLSFYSRDYITTIEKCFSANRRKFIIPVTLSEDAFSKEWLAKEYPAPLKTEAGAYVDFHPDFYCLNVRTRKEIIWEHFGMMDDLEYCEKTLKKIQIYEKKGFFAGQNLIFTMETATQPVSAKELELKIINFLL